LKNNQNLNTIFRDTTTQDAKNLKFKPQRPAIKWYDSKNFQNCRSELLRHFQNELVAYYNEVLGEGVAEKRTHLMTEVVPMEQMGKQSKKVGRVKGFGFNEKTGEGTGLYLKLLGEIGVLDLRQKDVSSPNQNNFQDYIDSLNKNYKLLYEISFFEIKKEELTTTIDSIKKRIEVIDIQDIDNNEYIAKKKNKYNRKSRAIKNHKVINKIDYKKKYKNIKTQYDNLKDDYEQLEKQKQVVSSVDTVEVENVKAKKIKKKAKKQSYWKTLKKKSNKMIEDVIIEDDNNINVVDIEQDSDYRIIDDKDYKENEEKE